MAAASAGGYSFSTLTRGARHQLDVAWSGRDFAPSLPPVFVRLQLLAFYSGCSAAASPIWGQLGRENSLSFLALGDESIGGMMGILAKADGGFVLPKWGASRGMIS
jgi:hypothetical protein